MLSVRALYRSIAKAIGAARSDKKFHCGEMRDRHEAFWLDSGSDVSVVVDVHRQVMATAVADHFASATFSVGSPRVVLADIDTLY